MSGFGHILSIPTPITYKAKRSDHKRSLESLSEPTLVLPAHKMVSLDSPKLRELSRVQLQSLAKREFVRAVGKTEDIIRRLILKHPKGVPAPEEGENTSASLVPPIKSLWKKARKDTPASSPITDISQVRTDPKGKGKAIPESTSPSPSSSTEALELLYPKDEPVPSSPYVHPRSISMPSFPENLSPILPLERPSDGVWNEDEDTQSAAPPPEASNHRGRAEDEEVPDDVGNTRGAPTRHMVVDALRQFTTLNDAIPTMETRLAESRCLLRRTENLLNKAVPDARELTVTREYLETFLLAKMKQKREVWDGTGRMEKGDRKLRMEWLRAQRRAENTKRWLEANEFNKQHGFKPEPFSAFASESDEEVIESLQTTPASSARGGGPKRPWEEVESNADSVGTSQKKRARS